MFLSGLWPGEYPYLVSAESITPAIFSIEEEMRSWVIVRGENEGIGRLNVVAEDFRGRIYRASVPVDVRRPPEWLRRRREREAAEED